MKKSLIALAALAATSAFAQSTVTISGGMVLGVGTSKSGATSSGNQIIRQTGNLAFSGTEDLGGGLKASFRLETTIGGAMDTRQEANNYPSSSTAATGAHIGRRAMLGDRGAFLALESAEIGTLLVGRAASGIRGNFGAVGDVSRLAVPSGLSDAGSAADSSARVIVGDAYSNQVAYQSPSFNGANVTVGVAPVEGNTVNQKDTMSYGLNYAAGKLAARYNLTDVKPTDTTAAATGYKVHTVNASYDFGVARVGFTHQSITVGTGVKPGSAMAFTANVPLGSGSIGLGYGKKGNSDAAGTRVGGDNVKQTFVGYRHDLSKRTHLQAVYNKIDRGGAATTDDLREMHLLVGHSF